MGLDYLPPLGARVRFDPEHIATHHRIYELDRLAHAIVRVAGIPAPGVTSWVWVTLPEGVNARYAERCRSSKRTWDGEVFLPECLAVDAPLMPVYVKELLLVEEDADDNAIDDTIP